MTLQRTGDISATNAKKHGDYTHITYGEDAENYADDFLAKVKSSPDGTIIRIGYPVHQTSARIENGELVISDLYGSETATHVPISDMDVMYSKIALSMLFKKNNILNEDVIAKYNLEGSKERMGYAFVRPSAEYAESLLTHVHAR